jgi:HPt (histidine-containing phosphotransfer) domain-containing protein
LSDARDGHHAAVEARMVELRRKFIARTDDDVAQMRAALARFAEGDRGGLEQIQQLAHRACGTGGTLGLDELSEAARELERLAVAIPPQVACATAERERLAAGIETVAARLAAL